ncbi:hypothetical protein ScPMuIL_004276 [Solemya velum]
MMHFSIGADKLLNVPNAGGSSVLSEVLSFELLHKCFRASLLKTEMEVEYFPEGGSITDYVCDVFGQKVGVSVTRAMKYRGQYTRHDALHLLNKKLTGVIQSSRNTLEGWSKQILHVWTPSSRISNTVTKVYKKLPCAVRHNTVVVVTTTDKSEFMFNNQMKPP